MLIFATGLKFLLALSVIFFLILSFLCYQWSAMHEKRVRMLVAAVVPFFYTFRVFFIGVVVLGAISLLFEFFRKPHSLF